MTRGFGKAIARLVDPFISESIWIQALQDLYARGGKTDTGLKFGIQETLKVISLQKV